MKKGIKLLLSFAFAVLILNSCRDKGRIVEPRYDRAHVMLQETNHNFGVLTDAQHVEKFYLTLINDGGEDLQITEVYNHCSCTHVEYPKDPIKAGHGVKLEVFLDVDDLGYGMFTRTIDIHTNSGTATLFLQGEKR